MVIDAGPPYFSAKSAQWPQNVHSMSSSSVKRWPGSMAPRPLWMDCHVVDAAVNEIQLLVVVGLHLAHSFINSTTSTGVVANCRTGFVAIHGPLRFRYMG
jgi:hypothetical protein